MAARRRKAAKRQRQSTSVKVVKAAMTMVIFHSDGRNRTLIIRPYDDSQDIGKGDITLVAPCGDTLVLPKAVAIAAANGVLELAAAL